jgi:hypothetical protein
MGAGFFQDLANQGATQNAIQTPNIMPTYQGGGVATTQGKNFNQTTNVAPYWGTYTAPVNINPANTAQTTQAAPENTYQGSGGQVYYDPQKGQYYTQTPTVWGFGGEKNYIGSSLKGSSDSGGSFDNPSPLPNYSMYIPPEHMPDINAYLQNPNSLLGALQSSGVPSAGAGRYSNLLSTNTSKGK